MDETVFLKPSSGIGSLKGRLNLSSCFAGQFVSCSFRAAGQIPKSTALYHTDYNIQASKYNPESQKKKGAGTKEEKRPAPAVQGYMNTFEHLCEIIYQLVFSTASDIRGVHGLLVVSGATASGKSQIARGVIYKYLKNLVSENLVPGQGSRQRRPHLVTFEDPIDERWADDPETARRTGIDYTPRELNKDVASLEQAVEAALRQTPRVFFVGETRRPKDWQTLLRFASTGHLSVTTSHAGSLTEAMGQLFRATGADTPARRSEIAGRILALVHLRKDNTTSKDNEPGLNFTLPAIWIKSSLSTKILMSDGLSGLLPYRDAGARENSPDVAADISCLGRTWFAGQLLSRAEDAVQEKFGKIVRSTALRWDLGGI